MIKLITSTKNRIKALAARPDRGATAAEYALIILLVTGAIVAGVTALGVNIAAAFNNIAGQIV
ncbi:Flp family type IVb pilin [Phytohabitans rumicis]|uniref:Flp family type IVb pilin n=1 Tax=Phytohabitans rumicis TaxID=1076125 RepID=A0A6V8L391_9ACTN|nr:Flp family type IVb pilin [Phytohabitans rumicis]GFJ90624.1 hypothetical protein Prum_042660 [Phytohabitans rumicis]